MASLKYRAEVDGLRGVAVLAVMLFHVGVPGLDGGYLGVDVFFVISGYLITSLIIKEHTESRFSLIDFYERRVRRIIPALFFVTFCTVPLAWLWYMPVDYKDFSQSLVAVATYLSNVLFFWESGYFDSKAELKPLLHTWSLGIEEQYYIIFPAILLMLMWLSPKRVMSSITAGIFLGIIFATWHTQHDASASFFLLPSRAWEFLAGSFVALYLAKNVHAHKSNELLGLIGGLLLLVCLFYFDKETYHPSYVTVVPVLASMLLLMYSSEATLTGKILRHPVLVQVGLISFSAYLWHQPLLAFSKYRLLNSFDLSYGIGLLCLSLILAFFTWRYVEKPFRDKSFLNTKKIFFLMVVSSIFLIGVGLFGHFTNGASFRVPPEYLPSQYHEKSANRSKNLVGVNGVKCYAEDAQLCYHAINDNAKRVLLVGDSHSGDFTIAFSEFVKREKLTGAQLSIGGCSFINSDDKVSSACLDGMNFLKQKRKVSEFDVVIVVGNFLSHISSFQDYELATVRFSHLIKNLLSTNIKLVLFTPRPSFEQSPMHAAYAGAIELVRIKEYPLTNEYNSILNDLAEDNRMYLYDQTLPLLSASCSQLDCFRGHTTENYPLYYDSNHLNDLGAEIVFNSFVPTLKEFIEID